MPRLEGPFRQVERLIHTLPPDCRPLMWLELCGGLGEEELSQALGKEAEETKALRQRGEEELERRKQRWPMCQRAAYIVAMTQLKDPSGSGFQEVAVPDALLTALWKEAGLPVKPVPQKPRKVKKPWNWKQKLAFGIAVALGVIVFVTGTLLSILAITGGA